MWQRWRDFFSKKTDNNKQQSIDELVSLLDKEKIPQHIAVIMDGNGRWAQKRGFPRIAGHRAGIEPIRKIVNIALRIGVKNLTLYAFSTENWKRAPQEVEGLMRLIQDFLWQETLKMHEKNVRVNAIGHLDKLPAAVYQELKKSKQLTEKNDALTVNFALNYGGRSEIISATKKIAAQVKEKKISLEEIDEKTFANYLFTKDLPDPELMIRTSGEVRLSNFLLWQLAYAEFWITPILWPDFKEQDFLQAILVYQGRDRRFGGVNL